MSHKVTSYFNIFECGRNLLDQLDVTYQQAFMATPAENENDYYKEMLRSDSLTSVALLSDKVSCMMISYDSSSFVTLAFKDGAVISV